MAEKVLVVGGGGREHALAWKLAQSPQFQQVLVAPGNAGTANCGKISNSEVSVSNHTILAQFCKDHHVGLVVVGPEVPLAAGIVDDLTAAGVPCFGPSAKAAQLEASKSFSKAFMERHGIPTARYGSFTDPQEACNYIRTVLLKGQKHHLFQMWPNYRTRSPPSYQPRCTRSELEAV